MPRLNELDIYRLPSRLVVGVAREAHISNFGFKVRLKWVAMPMDTGNTAYE